MRHAPNIFTLGLAFGSTALAACGDGEPAAQVTGEEGTYKATHGSEEIYSGSDYLDAITTALEAISSDDRLSIMASGSIGENTISVKSGITFEGCGTINAGARTARGAIESLDTEDVRIPYLHLTGSPVFGMRFYGVSGLALGEIKMDLEKGMGIRFERDEAANKDVSMDSINVTGASSHAVETWNIDGLTVGEVIARDVGECGLLLQKTTNAHVGLVDGDNVATDTGYAVFRTANANGRLPDESYETNVFVDKVVARGGGRGFFCVSQSGGLEIKELQTEDTGNNSVFIENCYGVSVLSGSVDGGGRVYVGAREEFDNSRDVPLTLEVNDSTVTDASCGENIKFDITGDAEIELCEE